MLAEKELIETSDLPIHLEHLLKSSAEEKKTEIVIDKILPLEEMEKRYILEVLKNVSWKKTQASKMLEISRQTLDNKIQKYNLTLEG